MSSLGRELPWSECLSLISPLGSPHSIHAISKQPHGAWLRVHGWGFALSTSSEHQQRPQGNGPSLERSSRVVRVVRRCLWAIADGSGRRRVTTQRGLACYPLSITTDQRSSKVGPGSPSLSSGYCRCSHFLAEQVPSSWACEEDQGSHRMRSTCNPPFPFLCPCVRAQKHLDLRLHFTDEAQMAPSLRAQLVVKLKTLLFVLEIELVCFSL